MAEPARMQLVPVDWAALPGWHNDDLTAAFAAFLISARGKLSSPALDAETAALASVSRAALAIPDGAHDRQAARNFFATHFTARRVVHDGPAGLLTGYYEPLLHGSRMPTDRFTIPVLRRPPDLVNIVAESARGATREPYTHLRRTEAGLVPYATREAIECGALAGQGLELLYVEDPVEAFFMHIQGSGRIAFENGETLRISYDGKNGHPYTSIGRVLIDEGVVGAEEMSLEKLSQWLREDPERGRRLMWRNQSYIFFRELTGAEAEGAMGVDGITLSPGRSLAVDTAYHPIGVPIYVVSPNLRHAGNGGGFQRLMIAQDVGSAIKGPERGDIFFGCGDDAGRLAGITKEPGTFFVLLPKDFGMARGTSAP